MRDTSPRAAICSAHAGLAMATTASGRNVGRTWRSPSSCSRRWCSSGSVAASVVQSTSMLKRSRSARRELRAGELLLQVVVDPLRALAVEALVHAEHLDQLGGEPQAGRRAAE